MGENTILLMDEYNEPAQVLKDYDSQVWKLPPREKSALQQIAWAPSQMNISETHCRPRRLRCVFVIRGRCSRFPMNLTK